MVWNLHGRVKHQFRVSEIGIITDRIRIGKLHQVSDGDIVPPKNLNPGRHTGTSPAR